MIAPNKSDCTARWVGSKNYSNLYQCSTITILKRSRFCNGYFDPPSSNADRIMVSKQACKQGDAYRSINAGRRISIAAGHVYLVYVARSRCTWQGWRRTLAAAPHRRDTHISTTTAARWWCWWWWPALLSFTPP